MPGSPSGGGDPQDVAWDWYRVHSEASDKELGLHNFRYQLSPLVGGGLPITAAPDPLMRESGHIRGACSPETRSEVPVVPVLQGLLEPGTLCRCRRHSPGAATAGTAVPLGHLAERLCIARVRDLRCSEKWPVHFVLTSSLWLPSFLWLLIASNSNATGRV